MGDELQHDLTAPLSGIQAGTVRAPSCRLMLVVAYTTDAARIGERINPGDATVALNRLEAPLGAGRLEDAQMSRVHAEFRRTDADDGLAVRDVGSRNGTMVNGERLDPRTWSTLRVGDVVRVGGTLLMAAELPVRRTPDAELPALVGVSDAMRALRHDIRTYAPGDGAVLILGESGVGKELVADAVHRLARPGRPFKATNLAANPETLLESALFGHKRGAFTGATEPRTGLFVEADRGTLFLDEIGELDPGAQAKLLRVLETGEVQPLGSERTRRVQVRLVAATNSDLIEAVHAERFRGDLYARLAHVTLRVPPLRDRLEDVPVLAAHFAAKLDRPTPVTLSVAALARLMRYPWPFNVRELKATVEQMVRGTPAGEPVHVPTVVEAELRKRETGLLASDRPATSDLEGVEEALRQSGGNMTRAAALMGRDRSHFCATMIARTWKPVSAHDPEDL